MAAYCVSTGAPDGSEIGRQPSISGAGGQNETAASTA